jgi:Kdo2-lipid IVA lauroyltransferase/acyltransferase
MTKNSNNYSTIEIDKYIESLPDLPSVRLKFILSLTKLAFYSKYKKKHKILTQNIDRVFGSNLSPHDKNKFIMNIISHFMQLIFEILLTTFLSRGQVKKKVCVIGEEHLVKAAESNTGVFMLTGHFGNWELIGSALPLCLKKYKRPFHCIRKNIKNKMIEKLLFRNFKRFGMEIISQKNAIKKITRALNKNHAIVFPFDQNTSANKKEPCIDAEFFGEKVHSYKSLATIVYHKKTPVIPAAMYRNASGIHVIELMPPIPWQEYSTKEESIYINTINYNKTLEKILLKKPEQWIWLYKRWRL